MGQGQEDIAIKALHNAGKQGHWIMLQKYHEIVFLHSSHRLFYV